MSDIKKIKDEFLHKLSKDLNIESVNQIKSELFGKNGKISNFFKNLGSLPPEERKKFASDLNFVKDELQEKINKKFQEIEIREINSKLENEKVDVTLPERDIVRGKIHPV
ncbi:phenylalanine--tRNA ligase subunit alpha, partial [Candidatus Pelagibacter sp.]|nr:phenylalanine--tRNA ligase subunit alpha [Candidatus Pelagibacter sp.]